VLTLDDVRPEVGGYGVRPVELNAAGEGEWSAILKLPPGLTPGWHEVGVRVGGSRPGPAKRIAVDIPLRVRAILIRGVTDGTTWMQDRIDLSLGEVVAVWATGLPENVDSTNLSVALGDTQLAVEYIGADQGGIRQINARVPTGFPTGPAQVVVSIGDTASPTADLTVVRTAGQ
jgi:hypothetical protein